MDEFVWLLLLFGIWIFEMVAKAIRKAQSDSREEDPDSSLKDPRVARRTLSRDVTESARRAEDALRRWEERQEAEVDRAPVPAPSRRRQAPVRRQSALEAIASMLVELPLEAEVPPAVVHEPAPAPVVARPKATGHRRATETVEEEREVPTVLRREESGLKRLARLPELQRAVVLNEILGPPVSLARNRDYGSA